MVVDIYDHDTARWSLLAELYLLQETEFITFFMYIAENNQRYLNLNNN